MKPEDMKLLLIQAIVKIGNGEYNGAMWRIADVLGAVSDLADSDAMGQPGHRTGLGHCLCRDCRR